MHFDLPIGRIPRHRSASQTRLAVTFVSHRDHDGGSIMSSGALPCEPIEIETRTRRINRSALVWRRAVRFIRLPPTSLVLGLVLLGAQPDLLESITLSLTHLGGVFPGGFWVGYGCACLVASAATFVALWPERMPAQLGGAAAQWAAPILSVSALALLAALDTAW
jgi:hypothetical protein